jgi:hypothetical protein
MRMTKKLKFQIQRWVMRMGYQITRTNPDPSSTDQSVETEFPVEISSEDKELINYVLGNSLSMVSVLGLCATLKAAKYVAENKIEGDFVECGVWRGGNAMIAAEVFRRHGLDKKVFLFDTFSGMTRPSDDDIDVDGTPSALDRYMLEDRNTYNNWCYAPIDEVRTNFFNRGLLSKNVVFIKGPVEQTLALDANVPLRISVLRLDTDWYSSTKLELEILFPKITSGGCLIIDDYGKWSGSKKATDEYFQTLNPKPLLNVVDSNIRIAIKF